jgi:hypothetical protein
VEIHKVKPIHTWRDFLKELGTIVLGIIIAISLEHLVQSWHWDQEVKKARQALAEEITANNLNILAFRVAVGPCVNRELDKADAILTALEAGTKPESIALLDLRRTPSSLIRDSEWQSERASQVLTHFPRAELALMSRYYAQLDDFKNWMAQEAIAWSELSILQKPLAGMTASDLIRLRVNLVIVKDNEYRIVLNARRQLVVTKQLGIPVPAADPVRMKNYCTMSTEQYRNYRNTQDLR